MGAQFKVWRCKLAVPVGHVFPDVPEGADWPVRKAAIQAVKDMLGEDVLVIPFTGWDGELSESELNFIEEYAIGGRQ